MKYASGTLTFIGFGLAASAALAALAWIYSTSNTAQRESKSPISTTTLYHAATQSTHPTAGSVPDLNQILTETDSLQRTQDLLTRVRTMPVEEIPRAMQEAEKSPNNDLALTLLAARWVNIDPQGAQDTITRTTDRRLQYLLTQNVYGSLAQKDPDGALQALQELPTQNEREMALTAIVTQVAKQDPENALKMVLGMKTYGGALSAVFVQWADQDLAAATHAALTLPRDGDRSSAIAYMSNHLAQEDPVAAVAWVDQLPPGDAQTNARNNIVGRWAFTDAPAAAAYLLNQPQLTASQERSMVQGVAVYWSQSDPKAACEWARKLPPESSQLGLQMALNNWARSDPKGAVDFLTSLNSDTKTKSQLAESIAQAWTLSDPQAALAWATQLPSGTPHDRAVAGVINQWGVLEPAKAASYIQALPPGIERHVAMVQMSDAWARDNPAAAVQWAIALPEDEEKRDIISSITGTWAKNDPVTASNWLAQMPSGPTRDSAVRSFSDQVADTDPSAAYQWASSIGDASLRQDQMTSTLRRWMNSDRASASVAVQQSSLSPEAKKQLLDLPQ